MRGGLAALFALLLAACTVAPTANEPTPAPTRDPATLTVNVLLDLSGPRAPSGQPQRNAMQLWLDQEQSRDGPRVRVKFVDLAGSEARLLVELRRAAVEDRADAVVIGAPFAYNETFVRALEVARLPVLVTVPVPEPAASRWAFGLAPTVADLARVSVRDAFRRDALVPVLLASDESPAAVAERLAIGTELERRGLVRPTTVTVTTAEAAQRLRPGASLAKSAFLTGPTATYADAARTIATFAAPPRLYLSYLTETADASALREGAAVAAWPGSRNVVSSGTPAPSGARAAFIQTYADRHGVPSTLAASAYDALALLDAVATTANGVPERTRLRERLETTTFAGISTRYAFTPVRHAGFDLDDLVLLRWAAGQPRAGFALVPEPAAPIER